MDAAITLQLPEDVLESLRNRAAQSGCTPESLAASWLSVTVRRIADDPLLKLAGTIKTLPEVNSVDEGPGPANSLEANRPAREAHVHGPSPARQGSGAGG